jgi:hypothetical protein
MSSSAKKITLYMCGEMGPMQVVVSNGCLQPCGARVRVSHKGQFNTDMGLD